MLKTIDRALLADLCAQAQSSPRLRKNHNLHPTLSDPVQRFLNAIEPGSYVRPHRHVDPSPKWELFVALAGSVAVLVLDDEGRVLERVELDAQGPNLAIEVPEGVWHTLVALRPGTVLFEFKQGPYAALSDKDFAAWAPTEDGPEAKAMVARFAAAQVGDSCRG